MKLFHGPMSDHRVSRYRVPTFPFAISDGDIISDLVQILLSGARYRCRAIQIAVANEGPASTSQ
jgi:hypothetical protein